MTESKPNRVRQISFRVPQDLRNAFAGIVKAQGLDATDILRKYVEGYVATGGQTKTKVKDGELQQENKEQDLTDKTGADSRNTAKDSVNVNFGVESTSVISHNEATVILDALHNLSERIERLADSITKYQSSGSTDVQAAADELRPLDPLDDEERLVDIPLPPDKPEISEDVRRKRKGISTASCRDSQGHARK